MQRLVKISIQPSDIIDMEQKPLRSWQNKIILNYLHRYDDYIECVHKAKQNLRVKAMYKKRHIDNHIEYLQVDMEIT